jgi:protein-tyrosine-phosphatase
LIVDTFSIVFVCTGNRFRSPLAEAFVRRLTLGLPVTTESFGMLEVEGAPALPEALEIARACGVDLSLHRTRQVGETSLADVDLLIGFEDSHVRLAVVDAEAPRHRAFKLGEVVRLLPPVEPPEQGRIVERARQIVKELADLRAAAPGSSVSDETPDPFGRSWNAYRETASEIRASSIRLAAALFGATNAHVLTPVPTRRNRQTAFWRR